MTNMGLQNQEKRWLTHMSYACHPTTQTIRRIGHDGIGGILLCWRAFWYLMREYCVIRGLYSADILLQNIREFSAQRYRA